MITLDNNLTGINPYLHPYVVCTMGDSQDRGYPVLHINPYLVQLLVVIWDVPDKVKGIFYLFSIGFLYNDQSIK